MLPSHLGLPRRFAGMPKDARSFFSYPRHGYFRRVLCNLLGTQTQRGELPEAPGLIGGFVREAVFDNAGEDIGLVLDPASTCAERR